MNQSELEVHVTGAKRGKMRKTVCFGFSSDCLREWGEFFKPNTNQSKTKPKQQFTLN